jgi:glycosyltransferase involved in cell wall biosynthesis
MALTILGTPDDPRPTVSVLVKSYNHAPYVRQTIDSVLSQSFQDFEIVVTDDASTDATADIVRGYKDRRIKLAVSPVNLGISGAMNATIARARGRYFAILNSDDWALPDRLRSQVAFLDRHEAVSLVFGLPRMVGEQGEPVEGFNDFAVPLRFPSFARTWWLRHFFLYSNCLSAPTAMIRREAYKTVGPYDRRLTSLQDMDMWIRMLAAGRDIHLLAEEVTAVRIRAGNANMSAPTLDNTIRMCFELGKVLRHYAAMDTPTLEATFGSDFNGVRTAGRPAPLRLAELALRDARREYQAFALDLIHQHASEQADFDWLRDLPAAIDPRGLRGIGGKPAF